MSKFHDEHTKEELLDFIESRGYRRCDILACNCNSFHRGHAETRLRELSELLGNRVQGRTLLEAVGDLLNEHGVEP